MASLNKVLLMGNLTREPELRYLSGSNAAVCEFGIAVNRRFSQNGQERDETCFLDIIVWGKQAESCSRFLQKGSSVFIEGRLIYDTWTEKDTQKKRSRLRVTAERVQFLSSSRRDGIDSGMDESVPGDDPTSQEYSSPRQSYSRGGQSGGGNYSRQQYDAPASQYGNARRGGNGFSNNEAAETAKNSNVQVPPDDPFENVEDIPF